MLRPRLSWQKNIPVVNDLWERMMIEPEENDKKSKSQVKRELKALQELGSRLVGLSVKDLKKIPMTEVLMGAVLDAKRFKREALRRQMQYIGALMRTEDTGEIQQALASILQPHVQEVRDFHEVERWRDDLLSAETGELLEDLCQRFKAADRRYLEDLVQKARLERDQGRSPKSARVLFRYLSGLRQEQ